MEPGTTATYDFVYTGIMREGEPIRFAASSDTAQFLWDFGDGTTDPHVYPSHIYSHSGVYNASVTVNGDTAHKVSKSVSVNPNTFPAYLASGMKTWHGHYTMSSASGYSSYGLPDSSFAVTNVDSINVRVFDKVLPYDKNSSGDLFVFTCYVDVLTRYRLSYDKSGASTFKIILSPPDSYVETAYTNP